MALESVLDTGRAIAPMIRNPAMISVPYSDPFQIQNTLSNEVWLQNDLRRVCTGLCWLSGITLLLVWCCEGAMLSDQYEKREKLGEGTYGRVYKVVHRTTGSTACLKELKSVGDGDDGLLGASTLREVSALQELSHPNIIQ